MISKNNYHWLTLKFANPKFEKRFKMKADYIRSMLFSSYTIGMSIFSIFIGVIALIQEKYFLLYYKIIQLAILISCKFAFNRYNNIDKNFILVPLHIIELGSLIEVLYPQVLIQQNEQLHHNLIMFTGIIIIFETIIAILPMDNWLLQYITLQFGVIYCLVRTMVYYTLLFILPIILFGILLGIFFYNYQKFQKEQFLQDYYQEKNYKKWQIIIEKIIPSVFIILQPDSKDKNKFKTVFFNQACQHFFQASATTDIISDFQQINVSQDNYCKESQNHNNCNTNNVEVTPNNTLYDIIQNQGQLITQNEQQVILSNCFYTKQQSLEKQYFDITLFGCKWNREKLLIINLNDISEKLRIQRMQEIDHYKDQLLATVTHDLKTPLNGMVSILEVTKSLEISDKLKYFLNIVLSNCFLLLFFIDDILDFSRIQYGKFTLIISQFSIDEVFHEIQDLMHYQTDQKQLKLEIFNINIKQLIFNDKNRLKQILINLVTNAIKFTFHGSIQIIAQRVEGEDNQIEIKVRDSGIGISSDFIPNLFQLYGIKDLNNQDNKQHGVGLGLSICKKLVEQIGPAEKQIKVDSQLGQGSTFTFTIFQQINNENQEDEVLSPKLIMYNNKSQSNFISQSLLDRQLKIAVNNNGNLQLQSNSSLVFADLETDLKQNQIQEYQQLGQNLQIQHVRSINPKFFQCELIQKITEFDQLFPKKTRILIVDDTAFNILGLKILLESAKNIVFTEAYNGKEALETIFHSVNNELLQFSIIFMDVNMPIMDGIEAIQIIRKEYQSQNYKIISFTAYDDFKDRKKCIDAGADAVIVKPITKDSLFEALRKLLQ